MHARKHRITQNVDRGLRQSLGHIQSWAKLYSDLAAGNVALGAIARIIHMLLYKKNERVSDIQQGKQNKMNNLRIFQLVQRRWRVCKSVRRRRENRKHEVGLGFILVDSSFESLKLHGRLLHFHLSSFVPLDPILKGDPITH